MKSVMPLIVPTLLLLLPGCFSLKAPDRTRPFHVAEIYDVEKVGKDGMRLREPVVTDFLVYVRSIRPTYGAIFILPSKSDPETFFRTGNVIDGTPRIEVGGAHLSTKRLPWKDAVTHRLAIVVRFMIRSQDESTAVVEATFEKTGELVSKLYSVKKFSDGTWRIEKVTFGAIS